MSSVSSFSTPAAPCQGWKSFLRYVASAFAVLLILSLAAYIFRAPLLTSAAAAWVVDDPATNADAIVILGGRPDLRVAEAARLYHQGVAPKILYMNVKLGFSAEIGIIPSEREQTWRLLLNNSVPETAMQAIGNAVASTYDEARAVRAWVETNGAKSILIPTDLSHTRRARWVFRKELQGTGAQIHVHAIQPREYAVTNWWKHEEGLIAFQNEVIKSLYYRLKY